MDLEVVSVPYRYDEREEGLGLGPGALLQAGLAKRLAAFGIHVAGIHEAALPAEERQPGQTAINIGRLGGHTAGLVALVRNAGRPVLVLAGDDTAAVGVVAGVQQAAAPGSNTGLVWIDAHGDFNTPETSYSGILAGMPVAIIAGLAGPGWRDAANLIAPIPTDRIVLAGVRDLDEREESLLRATDVRIFRASDLPNSVDYEHAIERLARRCDNLCVHVDLDVLDPRFVPSASTPSANGLTIESAAATIGTVLHTGKVATMSITSLNPGAGARGKQSIESTLQLLEKIAPVWVSVGQQQNA